MKRMLIVLLLLVSIFSLSACSSPSIAGVWRLRSGSFGYRGNEYEHCAIEFKDNGEFILYTGYDYDSEAKHGSYTIDNSVINLGTSSSQNRYTRNGERLEIVTFTGTAVFEQVSKFDGPKSEISENTIVSQYKADGYEVTNLSIQEQSEKSRVYKITLLHTYPYAREVSTRVDKYTYSPICDTWYLNSSSETIDSQTWQGIDAIWDFSQSRQTNGVASWGSEFDGWVKISGFDGELYIDKEVSVEYSRPILGQWYEDSCSSKVKESKYGYEPGYQFQVYDFGTILVSKTKGVIWIKGLYDQCTGHKRTSN